MPVLLRFPCGGSGSGAPKLSLPTDVSIRNLGGAVSIKWADPPDVRVDGVLITQWMGTRVVRKAGSPPMSKTDGVTVVDSIKRDAYKKIGLVDKNVTDNVEYFYGIFPYTAERAYTYGTVESITPKATVIYGFRIDQNKSDPSQMITYTEDNKDFTPAHMDYENDVFDYGDWADVWFIRGLKPCMLGHDGTVAYELDKDNYAQKTDHTDSDIANESFHGNAMVGIPKVYWKCRDNGDDTADFYFSDTKIDDTYHCWSHLDNSGKEIDYCYMPAYEGSVVDGVLRSLSGRAPTCGQTVENEIDRAKANNTTSNVIWYTEVFSDRVLINLLLLLIGRSTNTQAVFGGGNNSSYTSGSNYQLKATGTMNQKGLFWGSRDNKSGVKVFGIEHWWGNADRRIAGWVVDNGSQKVKMTYGISDGSGVVGYNLTGEGYIETTDRFSGGINSVGYVNKMRFGSIFGMVPSTMSSSTTSGISGYGSSSLYYCDKMGFASGINYALAGGSSASKLDAGAFYLVLSAKASSTSSTYNASLSCKPTAA